MNSGRKGSPASRVPPGPALSGPGAVSWQRLVLWTILFQIAWHWRKLPLLFAQGALPDTDDFLRLQQVRDWMSGQGWYDLVQHRMSPPMGADIHWSRLIDVPLAALISLFGLFTDGATAERLAAFVWPTLLLVVTVLVIVRICRILAADANPLLALLFTVMCVTALAEFAPGRIDHHSVQILLFCLALLGLASAARWWGHLLAGAAMAASVSIGLDAILLVVLILAWLGVEWAIGRDSAGNGLMRVAAGLAAGALALFPLNLPPSQWLAARCDANSIVYLVALVLIAGAFGLLAVLSPRLQGPAPVATAAMRLAAGAALAGMSAALIYWLFPQCAGGPYGALSAELATRWLVNVDEAMGLFARMARFPELWFSGVAYSLLLAATGGAVAWRHGRERPAIVAIYAALLLSIMAMAIQYRAMRIGVFAAIPLCVIFAGMAWQWLARRHPGRRLVAGALQAVLIALMLSPTWFVLGRIAFPEGDRAPGVARAMAKGADKTVAQWKTRTIHPVCNEERQYRLLASLPQGYVMSDINSGPSVLVFTRHAVVGGPYHRNEAAILDMLDFFQTDLDKPRHIAEARAIDYVAWCDPGDLTGPEYAGNPTLAVHLAGGNPPPWLEALSPADDRLQVYRVLR